MTATTEWQGGDGPPVLSWTEWLRDEWVGAAIVLGSALFALLVARPLLLAAARRLAARTRFGWDDVLLSSRALHWLSLLLPVVVLQYGLTMTRLPATLETGVAQLVNAAMWGTATLAIAAGIDAAHTIYRQRDAARRRSIKGFVQVVKLVVFAFGAIGVIAAAIGRDPLGLMAGLGAITAVLLLVFKDTITSLVASVQLAANDSVRVGDWIEVPSAGADGDVIDMALHTVTVQNWDKTISTVPTQDLVAKTFKNWRGMEESGGRRIKRSLLIDAASVRFLDRADLDRLAAMPLLRDYLAAKRDELARHEAAHPDSPRRLTNVGTFRAYLQAYLRAHPHVRSDMTMLVRQLQPTEHGLPIEMYLFTSTTAWADYERIQSDIVDHLLATVPAFDLRVFQAPTGADVRSLRPAAG